MSDSNTLSDPLNNRVVKTIRPPPHRPLNSKALFKNPQEVDWQNLMDHLRREGRITQADFVKLIDMTSQILSNHRSNVGNEPNLIRMHDPVTIVGDIHGQYYDFIKILEMGGNPNDTKYLFLGDYVDRGAFSIEVLIMLFSLKITYPKTVMLLRGNHECRQLTAYFNFKAECKNIEMQVFTSTTSRCTIASWLSSTSFPLRGSSTTSSSALTEASLLSYPV